MDILALPLRPSPLQPSSRNAGSVARRRFLAQFAGATIATLAVTAPVLAQEVRVQPLGDDSFLYVMPGIQQALEPTDGVPALIELDWAVEVRDRRMAELIHAMMPRIQNDLVLMLRRMTAMDFHGTAAALNFKRSLLTILESAHPQIAVRDVLLQNLHVY